MSTPPHHDPRGGFRNPWPGARLRGSLLDLIRWSIERRVKGLPADPDPRTLPRATPGFDAPRAASDALTITWVGHSTFLIQIGGWNVLTDPVWSDRASPLRFVGPKRWTEPGVALDALPPIDVVLLSHNHYDHLDTRTIGRIAQRNPDARWIAPLGVGALITSAGGGGTKGVTELDWWDETEVLGLRITGTPAQHFSARGLHDRNRTLWCGWTIASPAHRVYFAGDSALHPEFAQVGERLGPFDAALMPIGAYEPRWFMRPVHMNADEAVEAFQAIRAGAGGAARGAMVGMHWGTFKLTDEPMDEPPQKAREAWTRAGLDASDLWVMAFGETRRV